MKWVRQLEQLWGESEPSSAPLHLDSYARHSERWHWRQLGRYGEQPGRNKAWVLIASAALVIVVMLACSWYWRHQSLILQSQLASLRWQQDNISELAAVPERLQELNSWYDSLQLDLSANAVIDRLIGQARTAGLNVSNGEILEQEQVALGVQHQLRLRISGNFYNSTDFLQELAAQPLLLVIDRLYLERSASGLDLVLRLRYLQPDVAEVAAAPAL